MSDPPEAGTDRYAYGKNRPRDDLREIRVRSWREMEPPQGFAFPGDPREWEKKNCSSAKLTPLGEKLLGLKRWSD